MLNSSPFLWLDFWKCCLLHAIWEIFCLQDKKNEILALCIAMQVQDLQDYTADTWAGFHLKIRTVRLNNKLILTKCGDFCAVYPVVLIHRQLFAARQ